MPVVQPLSDVQKRLREKRKSVSGISGGFGDSICDVPLSDIYGPF